MSKRTLLKGTAILTIAGFLTRLIGFFYKIFLSNVLGDENLGIYQLIFPIYGICYNIYATGIQTTISRFVATQLGKKNYKNPPKTLRIGLLLSVSAALVLTALVFFNADYIAANFIYEPRSASSLKIMAIVFPFCGITSCINGYYYGLTKPGIPATTQLVEQIVRVSCIYGLGLFFGKGDLKVTIELAVVGLVIGEVSSTIFNILSYKLTYSTRQISNNAKRSQIKADHTSLITKYILKMSVPLTSNRVLISILHSVEAILIPNMLRKYGLTNADALIVYGVITGMAVPFIMFPSTLTNSLSVLLLPTISEADALNNKSGIKKTTALSIKYSLLIGILSTGIFICFGQQLGDNIFSNKLAGEFLIILAWLCPFLYIATTFTSILNALNKVYLSFASSVFGLSLRIVLILFLIPKQGIDGYFLSLLVSQIFITIFESIVIFKHIQPPFNAVDSILKPGIIITLSGYIMKSIYDYIAPAYGGRKMLLFFCLLLSLIYLILLWITKAISKNDLR